MPPPPPLTTTPQTAPTEDSSLTITTSKPTQILAHSISKRILPKRTTLTAAASPDALADPSSTPLPPPPRNKAVPAWPRHKPLTLAAEK